MNSRIANGAIVCSILALLGCGPEPQPTGSRTAATGIRFLADGESTGYARAFAARRFEFPQDHGPHRDFRTEWWYFTGNLVSAEERHFGFELTFFRYALTARDVPRESRWGSRQMWMAHFALTDTANRRFIADERISRQALGLAGVEADGFGVWVRGWSARQQAPGLPIELLASTSAVDLSLSLEQIRPVVLQGVDGLDRKGPEPGNASFYYSIPRLEVTGKIALAGEPAVAVDGLAWLDREWGTSALSDGIAGWDWFALQLSDGRDLMYYRLRTVEGEASEFSAGTLVDASGALTRLDSDAVVLDILDYWTSPVSRARYPVAWRLSIPDEALSLEITPAIPNQELDLSVRYWEGAVTVDGDSDGSPISGRGYLELAGYEPG